jgi:hypothetical protein
LFPRNVDKFVNARLKNTTNPMLSKAVSTIGMIDVVFCEFELALFARLSIAFTAVETVLFDAFSVVLVDAFAVEVVLVAAFGILLLSNYSFIYFAFLPVFFSILGSIVTIGSNPK